jgi:hypothetical protein
LRQAAQVAKTFRERKFRSENPAHGIPQSSLSVDAIIVKPGRPAKLAQRQGDIVDS